MATPVLTAHDPVIGFIAWTEFNIAYKGMGYVIPAGNTDQAYVWWQYNNGSPVLQTTSSLDQYTMTEDDLLLFLNKDGIPVNVQKTSFIDGSLLVNGTVATKALAAESVTADVLAADAVTAKSLAADALQGYEIRGAILDIDGAIHAETGYLDIIAESMEARSAIFNNNVTRRGTNNYLEGRETVSAGVSDPSSSPTVTATWPSMVTEATDGVAVCADGTGSTFAVLTDIGTLQIHDALTGAHTDTIWSDGFTESGGVTFLNDTYYVLHVPFMGDEWHVQKINGLAGDPNFGQPIGNPYPVLTVGQVKTKPAIGTDGTNLIAAYCNNSDSWRYKKFGPNDTTVISKSTVNLPGGSGNTDLVGVGGNTMISDSIWVQPANGPRREWSTSIMDGSLFDNGSTHVRPFDKPIVATMEWGFIYRSLDADGYLYDHHYIEGKIGWSYTWYDSDPAGAGTAESTASPERKITLPYGASALVRTPLPPDDGTVDAPDSVRIYADNNLQWGTYYADDLLDGVVFTSATTGQTPAPLESGFEGRASAIVGGFQSQNAFTDGTPIWEVNGDGSGNVAGLSWDSLGKMMGDPIKLVPTMAGVNGHNFFIKKILPGVVVATGYIDIDDSDLTRRDTGMRIPAGWEPTVQVISSAPVVGTNAGSYRFFFNTDGTIEFDQANAPNSPFESIVAIWFCAQ